MSGADKSDTFQHLLGHVKRSRFQKILLDAGPDADWVRDLMEASRLVNEKADLAAATDIWVRLLDQPGRIVDVVSFCASAGLSEYVIRLADDGVREEPDLSPVHTFLDSVLDRRLQAISGPYLMWSSQAILDCGGSTERSFCSRCLYIYSLVVMQFIRTGFGFGAVIGLGAAIERRCADLDGFKGGRITPRLIPTVDFLHDLAVGIRSLDADPLLLTDVANAWRVGGFERMFGRLDSIRREYIAGAVDRVRGVEDIGRFLKDYMEMEPLPLGEGHVCRECSTWTPVVDWRWRCDKCGNESFASDAASTVERMYDAIAEFDSGELLELAKECSDRGTVARIHCCVDILNGALGDMFGFMGYMIEDGLISPEDADRDIRACISVMRPMEPIEEHVGAIGMWKLLRDIPEGKALGRWLAKVDGGQGDVGWARFATDAAAACVIMADTAEEAKDVLMDAYMGIESAYGETAARCTDYLDAFYNAVEEAGDWGISESLGYEPILRTAEFYLESGDSEDHRLMEDAFRMYLGLESSEGYSPQIPDDSILGQGWEFPEGYRGMGAEELEGLASAPEGADLHGTGGALVTLYPERSSGWRILALAKIQDMDHYDACVLLSRALELAPEEASGLAEIAEEAVAGGLVESMRGNEDHNDILDMAAVIGRGLQPGGSGEPGLPERALVHALDSVSPDELREMENPSLTVIDALLMILRDDPMPDTMARMSRIARRFLDSLEPDDGSTPISDEGQYLETFCFLSDGIMRELTRMHGNDMAPRLREAWEGHRTDALYTRVLTILVGNRLSGYDSDDLDDDMYDAADDHINDSANEFVDEGSRDYIRLLSARL